MIRTVVLHDPKIKCDWWTKWCDEHHMLTVKINVTDAMLEQARRELKSSV